MKLGIVGAGKIVPDFLEAVSLLKEFELISISATENGRARMEEHSKQYGIKNIFVNYDDLLNSDVEVVYIAVPNHLHYEFAKKAIEKNKHIILEKPFTSTYEEAKELVKLSREKKIMIFEAITNQYLPNYKKTKELLDKLGDVKIVQLNYSQYSSRYDNFKKGKIAPVFDPKKSGGALMDLNIYNVYYVVGLFGKPEKINYSANIEKGIDTSGILVLEYPTFKCSLVAAKDCVAPLSINIQGDKAFIHSKNASNIYDNFIFGENNGNEKEFSLNENKPRLYFELKEFLEIYTKKDYAKLYNYNNKALIVMDILENARKQAGIEFE